MKYTNEKSNQLNGVFTGSMLPGLTKDQLLKLVKNLPEDGFYIPHSIRNDSLDEIQIFGLLRIDEAFENEYDDSELEALGNKLIDLYKTNGLETTQVCIDKFGRKYRLNKEKYTLLNSRYRKEYINKRMEKEKDILPR